MASRYWIKLYHEILEDPKMGRLPDNLWRRTIELFLLAGDLDKDGELLDIEGIAWKLRMPCNETLQKELQQLLQCNILSQHSNGIYVVTHFSERQKAADGAERVRRFREKKRQESPEKAQKKDKPKRNGKRNGSVTKSYIDIDKDKDKEQGFSDEQNPESNGNGLTPSQAMFSALAKACKIDYRLATKQQLGELNQTEKLLRVKARASPEDLPEFEKWWKAYDWRGKKGDAPKPAQVREEWQKFIEHRTEQPKVTGNNKDGFDL